MEGKDQTGPDGPKLPQEQDSASSAPPAAKDDAAAASDKGPEPVPKNLPPPRGPKRRTKTGCLTCRKRRIKCGEEKPKCKNCIKAKRECSYMTRVIFKHPLGPFGAFQPGVGLDMRRMAMRVPLFPQQPGQPSTGQALGPQQRLLAPRIPNLAPAGPVGFDAPLQAPPVHGNPVEQPHPFFYPPLYETTPSQALLSHAPPSITPVVEGHGPERTQSSSFGQTVYQQPFGPDGSYQLRQGRGHYDQVSPAIQGVSDPFHGPQADKSRSEVQAPPSQGQVASMVYDREVTYTSPILQTLPSRMGCYDDESDDYYDVESDEETEETAQEEGYNQLSLIMASANQDDLMIRSYTTFLNEPNILATYHPSMGSSPLNNPKTARIWVHFIHATGPSLSIWERHPINSSVLFSGPVPTSQQGLWTYTLPLKSLEHPALLQAILAVSSLHIAKLQQAPLIISLKHYHYALRRIGKAVGLPLRRKQVATLAATLVLGFYEVMAAEHSKWNSHVAGAAQLIKEIDFAGITRDLRAQRRNVKAQRDQMAQADPWFGYGDFSGNGVSEDDPFAEKEADINEELIGALMGKAVNYDQFGQVESEGQRLGGKKHFTRKDIENFRIQCDLYWWYCKQDLFQSMVSGNRLYLPYDRWGQCPPRAGLGKMDSLYGSYDHLILLLGRLVDFGFRDRKRKLKRLEATGGEWRPHPGFFKFMARFGGKPPNPGPSGGTSHDKSQGTGPSSSNPSIGSSHGNHTSGDYRPTGPPGPHPGPQGSVSNANLGSSSMYGMMPSSGPSDPPAAFADTAYSQDPPPRGESNENDAEMSPSEAEAAAEAEWESILAAFELYASQLGPGFAPLPAYSAPPISTPFGQALQYRSHQVAVLWAFYYTGRIVLHRMHPCMPPAAMMAASVAAPTTAEYAQAIAKIAAGIYYPQRYNLEAGSLNPMLGAALTEVTVPMFFAGVQFTDPAQRGWTVAKLHNIARLTGWQSAASVASGCEAAWHFAAKAGRGPPYSLYEARTAFDEEGMRGVHRSHEADRQIASDPNNNRRFVKVAKSARTRWAMGLLEMEDDLVNLSLDDQ
ncbi:hypothetical protein VTN77DRAFT_7393 [Rasamsonia byssochlamydoides]|uniref:uncharacterized protein n=1 Tax=Rasamsonia byssochlamydoides TaxID=89139 RepID=UPI003743C9A7